MEVIKMRFIKNLSEKEYQKFWEENEYNHFMQSYDFGQIRKYKTKIQNKKQADNNAIFEAFSFTDDSPSEDTEIKIVKTKTFDMKPMTPEEACLQMELVGHDFFVFSNAELGKICVVYKRGSDSYGLILPN